MGHGILSFVAMACRDDNRLVKEDALWAIGNLITKLCDDECLSLIRSLLKQYDIELNLLEVLRNDYASPEGQQTSLHIY